MSNTKRYYENGILTHIVQSQSMESYKMTFIDLSNNNLKENKMNLKSLREGKTTKFNEFITPIKDIFEKEYGELLRENTDQVDNLILSDIHKEIIEKYGTLVYITQNDRLVIGYKLRNKYNLYNSSSITVSDGMQLRMISNNKDIDILERIVFIAGGYRESPFTNKLDNLYYISDEKKLVEFYNKEQQEALVERQKKEQELLEERQKQAKEEVDKQEMLLNKTIEYGLEEVNEQLISKLDAIKELKAFDGQDPKEVLKLIETISGGSNTLLYSEMEDIARDVANSVVDDHECEYCH
jgi:hypothetical protein